jgi:death-on-curing protein
MLKVSRKLLKDIHDDILLEAAYSGEEVTEGVLSEGNLDEIIYRINKKYHENEMENLFEKAAWALYLADCHPFWDGQKRTAYQLADLILRSEGYHIHAEEDEVIGVLTRIAKYECHENVPKIIGWLKKSTRKLDRSRQLHFGQSP